MKCGASQNIDMGVTLPPAPSPNHDPSELKDKQQFPPCPECGAERIFAYLSEGTYVAPSRFSFAKTSQLNAVVCTNCGLTTLYARKPKSVIVKRPDKPRKDA
jgi:DNA-directed RNA polymerase subunit RPC12/RpoP